MSKEKMELVAEITELMQTVNDLSLLDLILKLLEKSF